MDEQQSSNGLIKTQTDDDDDDLLNAINMVTNGDKVVLSGAINETMKSVKHEIEADDYGKEMTDIEGHDVTTSTVHDNSMRDSNETDDIALEVKEFDDHDVTTSTVNENAVEDNNETEDIAQKLEKVKMFDDHDNSLEHNAETEEEDLAGTSVLSIDVSQSEIGIFDDSETDDGTCSVEDIEQGEGQQELLNSSVEPLSRLHCVLCGNNYTDPRLLDCLHTFCLQCLAKYVKQNGNKVGWNDKSISCPVCRAFTPTQNVQRLQVNLVMKNHINAMNEGKNGDTVNCVVCLLHNDQKEVTGRCSDCGDLLCESCCEKHTFSRQTAKHTVVQFDENSVIPTISQTTFCSAHSDEIANSYCLQCRTSVCSNCVTKDHASHKTSPINVVVRELKKNIDSSMQGVDLKLATLESKEHTDHVMAKIHEKEKEQLQILQNGKEKLIRIIEKDFEKHVQILERICKRQRNECEKTKRHIVNRRKDLNGLMETVDFLFAEGKADDVMELDKRMKNRVKAIEKNINNTKQVKDVTDAKNSPRVYLYEDNIKKVKEMYFFSVHIGEKHAEQSMKATAKGPSVSHQQNNEVRSLLSSLPMGNDKTHGNNRRHQRSQKQQGVEKSPPQQQQQQRLLLQQQPQLNQLSLKIADMNLKAPVGRGALFANMGNHQSLLGDYVGPGGAVGNRQGVGCARGSRQTVNPSYSIHGLTEDQRFVRLQDDRSHRPVTLKLISTISVQTTDDKKLPDIVDIVFTSLDNFVVCDTRNQILKAFSCTGQFLDFIKDPGPTSLTYCRNYLIWNSQFSTIKSYNIVMKSVTNVQQLTSRAEHPLTSFSNDQYERYLVGNVRGSTIGAFTLEGEHVLSIRPTDRSGKVLPNISQIAAYMDDQMVVVDSQLKKVVVINFDGCCIGEFSKPGMDPSAVCITESNQIFVTDKARDKLILLSGRAEFLKEWSTIVEKPQALAVSGNGTLVVTGNSKLVRVYQYSLGQ